MLVLGLMKQQYALNKNKYLLDPEKNALESTLHRFMATDERNCLMLLLALKTGGRAQEVLNLRVEDIDHHNQTVFIRGIKGSNDREIPIQAELFLALWGYVVKSGYQSSDRVFPITYNRLFQIWDNYKPTKKKFHSLRHTFAIQLYRKTKDIRLVQVALGHRNIVNTMVYADYVYSQDELKKLIL